MADKQQPQSAGEYHSFRFRRIPLANLLLDNQNPRLTLDSAEPLDQDQLASLLWKTNAVDEIALSIAANGYYEDEPLLAISENTEPGQNETFIVVEGNRRLAAVNILTNTDLRTALNALDLPRITHEMELELQTLPVSVHSTREELWTHIGFRHINGIKPWDGLGKSRYIAHIHETYDVPLDDIASRIGDKHSTVLRLYRGYRVLRQAECDLEFDIKDTFSGKFHFSHLYTALSQKEYQDFLDITPSDTTSRRPISTDKLPELKELFAWLFGTKSEREAPIVRRQYPDLNHLRQIISIPESLAALRNGYPLDTAYAIALGDTRRFKDSVFRAVESLKEALGTLTLGYTGEEAIRKAVDQIHILATKLQEELDRYESDRTT